MFGFRIVREKDLEDLKSKREIVWSLIQKIGDQCFDKNSKDEDKLSRIQELIIPLASAELEDDIALTMMLIEKH